MVGPFNRGTLERGAPASSPRMVDPDPTMYLALSPGRSERLIEITNQIIGTLEPDRHAHQALGQRTRPAYLGPHGGVRDADDPPTLAVTWRAMQEGSSLVLAGSRSGRVFVARMAAPMDAEPRLRTFVNRVGTGRVPKVRIRKNAQSPSGDHAVIGRHRRLWMPSLFFENLRFSRVGPRTPTTDCSARRPGQVPMDS